MFEQIDFENQYSLCLSGLSTVYKQVAWGKLVNKLIPFTDVSVWLAIGGTCLYIYIYSFIWIHIYVRSSFSGIPMSRQNYPVST